VALDQSDNQEKGCWRGAEIIFRAASNIICIPWSLASRFVDEIALVYTSSVIRD